MIKGIGGMIGDDPIKKLQGVIQSVSIYTLIIGILLNNHIGSCEFKEPFQFCRNVAYVGISTLSVDP